MIPADLLAEIVTIAAGAIAEGAARDKMELPPGWAVERARNIANQLQVPIARYDGLARLGATMRDQALSVRMSSVVAGGRAVECVEHAAALPDSAVRFCAHIVQGMPVKPDRMVTRVAATLTDAVDQAVAATKEWQQ